MSEYLFNLSLFDHFMHTYVFIKEMLYPPPPPATFKHQTYYENNLFYLGTSLRFQQKYFYIAHQRASSSQESNPSANLLAREVSQTLKTWIPEGTKPSDMQCKNIPTTILDSSLNKINYFLNIIVDKLPGLIFEKFHLFFKKRCLNLYINYQTYVVVFLIFKLIYL